MARRHVRPRRPEPAAPSEPWVAESFELSPEAIAFIEEAEAMLQNNDPHIPPRLLEMLPDFIQDVRSGEILINHEQALTVPDVMRLLGLLTEDEPSDDQCRELEPA